MNRVLGPRLYSGLFSLCAFVPLCVIRVLSSFSFVALIAFLYFFCKFAVFYY